MHVTAVHMGESACSSIPRRGAAKTGSTVAKLAGVLWDNYRIQALSAVSRPMTRRMLGCQEAFKDQTDTRTTTEPSVHR